MSRVEGVREEIRDGWILKCPYCGAGIKYTRLSNWEGPTPFFYSKENNDVLLRKSDVDRARDALDVESKPSVAELERMWCEFLENTPKVRAGSSFGFWSNVKCPHCRTEMPYNNGVKDPNIRIYEPKIVLIDGAIVWGDDLESSWRVRVNV